MNDRAHRETVGETTTNRTGLTENKTVNTIFFLDNAKIFDAEKLQSIIGNCV